MTQSQGKKAVNRSRFWMGWILDLINRVTRADFINILKEFKETMVKKLKGKYDGTGPAHRKSEERKRN